MMTVKRGATTKQHGYTLIELILVVVIIGVLASVAMRSMRGVNDAVKIEKTKQALDRLAYAIAGNPELKSNGIRIDYGYYGDIGALPATLDNLVTNPGYAIWKGPYIHDEISPGGAMVLFKQDGWGQQIAYAGGLTLTSSGGGSNMVRSVATATAELAVNSVRATVTDLAHHTPGPTFKDSVKLVLTYPNGAGATTARTKYPDANGWVKFDSIPMGLHDLKMVYIPNADTITRKIPVSPGEDVYVDLNYFRKVW